MKLYSFVIAHSSQAGLPQRRLKDLFMPKITQLELM